MGEVGGTTKTDASRELDAIRVDRERGEAQRQRSLTPTVAEVADEWLAHLQSRVGISDERRRYSQRTVDLYRQRLDDHICKALGGRPISEITVDDVRRLVERLSAKGLASGTVTSCVNITSGLMRYALKRKLVPHNVVRDLDRDDRPGSKRQSEPRYLTASESELLLSKLGDTFRPVMYVCLFAGLRISETLGLRWRDVDLKAEAINVEQQLGTEASVSRLRRARRRPRCRCCPPCVASLSRTAHAKPSGTFGSSAQTRSSSRRPAGNRSHDVTRCGRCTSGRRRRGQRRRGAEGRPARSAALVRRARVRAGRGTGRGCRGRPSREPARDAHDVRRADERRARASVREAARQRLRQVKTRYVRILKKERPALPSFATCLALSAYERALAYAHLRCSLACGDRLCVVASAAYGRPAAVDGGARPRAPLGLDPVGDEHG